MIHAQEKNYRPKPSRRSKPKLGNALIAALETAEESHLMIADEQERLRALLEEDRKDGQSPEWLAGREWQIWLVEQQLTRATELARERIEYFSKIRDEADVEREEARCAADKHHWFRMYAWGFDPRPDSPLNTIPITPFEFQSRYLDWLDRLVFHTRQSGVAPKSRDMGATEWALRWSTYYWKYRESFEVLLLSRTEDEVDSKKDVNTLFEKVRFQMRLLPEWMLPDSFSLDKDMPYMIIQNPETKSTFHGRAPTENVGRQLRVALVHYDESAFAPNGGYKQHTALSQTTKSVVDISSVAGRLNKFADLMTDGKTPQFIMDWRDHPWKTPEWYNALKTGVFGTAMTDQEIAQEIDRDLDASQPGKVWHHREEYLFMTWSEVVQAFDKFGFGAAFRVTDANGNFLRYRVPKEWKWMRYHDKGATEGHQFAYLLAAKPGEYYPYHDTMFVFIAQELKPTGLTYDQAYGQWRDFEQEMGFRDDEYKFTREPTASRNSHEAKNLRKVLREEFGDYWDPWDTDYIAGIDTVQKWFNVIDTTKPNPFRPELAGRCRVIFVAPDNEYKLAFNQQNGSYVLTTSRTERGFMTLRKQIPAYHYPPEERGKDVKQMRPAKQFDDIIDTLRACAVDDVKGTPKTEHQEVEQQLEQSGLGQAEIAQHYGEEEFGQMVIARQLEERAIKARIEEQKKAEVAQLTAQLGGRSGGARARLLGGRRR